MRAVRTTGFAIVLVFAIAAIVVPAARAQRAQTSDWHVHDARTVAHQKISAPVLAEIYRRRGDGRTRAGATAQGVQIDRHGRALVDVRARVQPGLQKKIKALGGVVVSTSRAYDSSVVWMPLLTLERLAADPSVRSIEAAS